MSVGLWSCGQSSKSSPDKIRIKEDLAVSSEASKKPQSIYPNINQYIHTDSTYTDTGGPIVTIINSYPKGGPYHDPSGRSYGRVVFWHRVINRSTAPIELEINFPGETYAVPPSPDSYLKLLLPPGIFTLDDLDSFNFGASELDPFLDDNFDKPTTLRETIQPNEEVLFWTAAVSYNSGGTVRAGLVVKGQDLFYKISIYPHFESLLFPCGKISIKK